MGIEWNKVNCLRAGQSATLAEGPATPPAPWNAAAAALDIVRQLSGALTRATLFDTISRLALTHARALGAGIVCLDGEEHHVITPAGAPPLPAHVASAIDLANQTQPGQLQLIDLGGGAAGAVLLLGEQSGQQLWLCSAHATAPSQHMLDILSLIGECGASALQALERIERLQADKDMLAATVDARLSLATHLADERSLLRTIIDNMPDQIYVKDPAGRFVLGNAAAAECIGVGRWEDLVGKSDLELFPGDCGRRFFIDEQNIMRSGEAIVDQLEENINLAGVRRWYSTTKVPFKDEHGRVIGIVGMSRDVSLRVAADEEIKLRNRAIESSVDAIVITSCLREGNPVVYVNPAFERITGFSFDEATQGGIDRLLALDDEHAPQELIAAMRDGCEGRAVLQSRRKNDTVFWNEVRLAPVRDMSGRATHFVYTMTDITKARDSEEKLERLASHDVLTGLPNRRMLMDRLGQAIALGERGDFVVAVAFIDLDRLKFVNDSFGHDAGDLLITSVADRMQTCVRKSDTVARLGGDEFVLLSLHNVGPDAAREASGFSYVYDMLAKVQAALAEPVMVGDKPFSVTCSIGVSIFPQHGKDADTLLKHADEAMYVAKKTGRNKIEFYSAAAEQALALGGDQA